MKFQVILPKSVQKELNRLPDDIARRQLMSPPETKRREIGFHVKHEDEAKQKAKKR